MRGDNFGERIEHAREQQRIADATALARAAQAAAQAEAERTESQRQRAIRQEEFQAVASRVASLVRDLVAEILPYLDSSKTFEFTAQEIKLPYSHAQPVAKRQGFLFASLSRKTECLGYKAFVRSSGWKLDVSGENVTETVPVDLPSVAQADWLPQDYFRVVTVYRESGLALLHDGTIHTYCNQWNPQVSGALSDTELFKETLMWDRANPARHSDDCEDCCSIAETGYARPQTYRTRWEKRLLKLPLAP